MIKINQLGVVLVLATLAACGGGSSSVGSGKGAKGRGLNPTEGEIHGSCYQHQSGSCNEFVGAGWTMPGVQPRCGLGLADPNPCPSENVIGRCNFMEMPMDADTRTYYYVSAAWQEDDLDFLRDMCVNSLRGTFDEL